MQNQFHHALLNNPEISICSKSVNPKLTYSPFLYLWSIIYINVEWLTLTNVYLSPFLRYWIETEVAWEMRGLQQKGLWRTPCLSACLQKQPRIRAGLRDCQTQYKYILWGFPSSQLWEILRTGVHSWEDAFRSFWSYLCEAAAF